MKKKKEEMVTVSLAELLDISARLNAAGCVPEIAADLSRLIDYATVSDKGAQYLWNRMLKTGKTQFTRNDIHKLTTNSRLLPTMGKAYMALNTLVEQEKLRKGLARINGNMTTVYIMGCHNAVNTTEDDDETPSLDALDAIDALARKYRS